MQFTLQLVLRDDQGETCIENVFEMNRPVGEPCAIGLSLQESKTLLKTLQRIIVNQQAAHYTHTHRACPCCGETATHQRQPYLALPHAVQHRADPKSARIPLCVRARKIPDHEPADRMACRA